jgi:hypothetical protein
MDLLSNDAVGYLASCLVLATFATRTMSRLRVLAILSNLAFIYYAVALELPPVLALHSILLPLNVWRLGELRRQEPPHSPLDSLAEPIRSGTCRFVSRPLTNPSQPHWDRLLHEEDCRC